MDAVCANEMSWLVDDPPDTPGAVGARKARDARNIIETLGNLFYLIQLDAENPGLVRSYTAQAEERLRALIALLPDSLPTRAPNKGLKIVHGSAQSD